jgi:hypothetical protein
MDVSVKVMLSYDYNHFEILLSEECESLEAVNRLRKSAQRLADEAVRQYKIAKEMAAKRETAPYKKEVFLRDISLIQEKPKGERTVNELAMLKQYKDESWQEQFAYQYDYEDDLSREDVRPS